MKKENKRARIEQNGTFWTVWLGEDRITDEFTPRRAINKAKLIDPSYRGIVSNQWGTSPAA